MKRRARLIATVLVVLLGVGVIYSIHVDATHDTVNSTTPATPSIPAVLTGSDAVVVYEDIMANNGQAGFIVIRGTDGQEWAVSCSKGMIEFVAFLEISGERSSYPDATGPCLPSTLDYLVPNSTLVSHLSPHEGWSVYNEDGKISGVAVHCLGSTLVLVKRDSDGEPKWDIEEHSTRCKGVARG